MNYWTIYFFFTGVCFGVAIGLVFSVYLHGKENRRKLKPFEARQRREGE